MDFLENKTIFVLGAKGFLGKSMEIFLINLCYYAKYIIYII